MFVSKALKINSKNHLEIGGCDCVDLVKEYGTSYMLWMKIS